MMKKMYLKKALLAVVAGVLGCGSLFAQQQKVDFSAVAMNVDGLPAKILFVTINGDGPGSAGTKLISQKIAERGWDFVGCSEDFENDTELRSALTGNYNFGTYRSPGSWTKALTGKLNTDGLQFMWRKNHTATNETFVEWKEKYGGLTDGANTCLKKGYRYYTLTLDGGIEVDMYILHMDAGTGDDSNGIKHGQYVQKQWAQLVAAIKASNNKRPIIVMGDTNCRYTRIESPKSNFIDVLNADPRFDVHDGWIDKCKGGVYPQQGTPALTVGDLGYVQGEIVDKLFYINNTDAEVQLTLNQWFVDTQFIKADGTPLADHFPVVGYFTATKGQEVTEPEQPGTGGEGGETVDPEQPGTGGETVDPEEPGTGGETVDPEQPSTGGETVDPEQPGTGGETTEPEEPEEPIVTPEEPEDPIVEVPEIALAGETFYFQNVESGKYMDAGASWGTHAITSEVGHILTLEQTADHVFRINSHITNGGKDNYLTSDLYLDGAATAWTFARVGQTNAYVISCNGKAITEQNGNVVAANVVANSAAQQWKMVTKEERDAQLEEASEENPIDVTYLFHGVNFNRNDNDENAYWNTSSVGSSTNRTYGIGGHNDADYGNSNYSLAWKKRSSIFQSVNSTFDVNQTVKNLPNGTYLVTVQAFYRDGEASSTSKTVHANFYVNSTSKAIHSVRDESNAPTTQEEASAAFSQGKYKVEAIKVVVTNGQIKFGVKKTTNTTSTASWTCFDNFRFTYLGGANYAKGIIDWDEIPEEEIPLAIDEAESEAGVDATYNMDGTISNQQSKGVKIVKMSNGTVRKVLVK